MNSLDFKPGDNVVFDNIAYRQRPGVEMRIVRNRNGAATVEDFAKLVDKSTRMISVTWVSNTGSHRHDMKGLADLAHSHDAYIYADAVQLVGTAR